MGVKKYKPTTPGLRSRVGNSYEELTTAKPYKKLLAPMKKSGGRNNTGKMTMRHIGGGHKRRYRIIDFKRVKDDHKAIVKTVEYDPNRTAFISLIEYADGEKRYMLAPAGIAVGQEIASGQGVAPELGNSMYLKEIPLGTVIYNVEMVPGRGGVLARSAGSYAQIVAKEGKYAILKMPSSETRMVLLSCRATIGSVSNPDHQLQKLGKAGRKRWLGRRPRVRGVAMNPVDHPMGGGEGKASGGHPRSRTGIFAKGQKTRNKKKASNRLIITRRKTGKKK